jgi:hypothetical protein
MRADLHQVKSRSSHKCGAVALCLNRSGFANALQSITIHRTGATLAPLKLGYRFAPKFNAACNGLLRRACGQAMLCCAKRHRPDLHSLERPRAMTSSAAIADEVVKRLGS